ncbi:hypothetical protein ACFOVU_02800 [Nocardiopsis sediminis]|uniref:Uncharacterized protein n=1 Tax=Nocardiopsis sediminis TaxID=1778267 RepID=A0ABV8FFE4_9ACTN
MIELHDGPLDGTRISTDLARLVAHFNLGGIDLPLADFLGPHTQGIATYAPNEQGRWLYRGTVLT